MEFHGRTSVLRWILRENRPGKSRSGGGSAPVYTLNANGDRSNAPMQDGALSGDTPCTARCYSLDGERDAAARRDGSSRNWADKRRARAAMARRAGVECPHGRRCMSYVPAGNDRTHSAGLADYPNRACGASAASSSDGT